MNIFETKNARYCILYTSLFYLFTIIFTNIDNIESDKITSLILYTNVGIYVKFISTLAVGVILSYLPSLIRDTYNSYVQPKFYNCSKLFIFERYLIIIIYLLYNLIMLACMSKKYDIIGRLHLILFRMVLICVLNNTCQILSKSEFKNIWSERNVFIVQLFGTIALTINFVIINYYLFMILILIASIIKIYLTFKYYYNLNISAMFSSNIKHWEEQPIFFASLLSIITNIHFLVYVLKLKGDAISSQNINSIALQGVITFQFIRFYILMYCFSLIPSLISDINNYNYQIVKQLKTETDHEMRTPLMVAKESILYTINTLFPKISTGNLTEMNQTINLIKENCVDTFDAIEVAISQITKQSDFRKLLNNNQTYELSDIDIFEVIKRVTYMFLQTAATEGITINIISNYYNDNTFNKKCILYSDYNCLRVIITNIISNAIKFSGKSVNRNNGIIDVNILSYFKLDNKKSSSIIPLINDIESNPAHNIICIRISDNGIGISETDLKKLGNEGFQIKPENQAGGGSGYGIGIIKKHIENLGGSVKIYSKLNEGTTFEINFPLKRYEDIEMVVVSNSNDDLNNHDHFCENLKSPICAVKNRQNLENDSEIDFTQIKINDEVTYQTNVLIVDDSAMVRKVTSRKFKDYGWNVDVLEDGQDVINLINNEYTTFKHKYDIIFLDNQMKIINGPQVAHELRKNGYTKPIFGLTGNVERALAIDFQSKGANAIISKPYTDNIFFDTLDNYNTNYNVNTKNICRKSSRKNIDLKYEFNSKTNSWDILIKKENIWCKHIEFYINSENSLDIMYYDI